MRTIAGTAVALAWAAGPATAYVEALYPLQRVIQASDAIAEGRVESVDKGTRTALLRVTRRLKGDLGFREIRMNLGSGRSWHPDALLRHVVPGETLLLFSTAERRAEAYAHRYFFQLHADPAAAPDSAWWTVSHIEVRMNRTYNGPAAELAEVVRNVLAGRAKAPPPEPELPPITREAARALPPPGEAVDDPSLPPAFRRRVSVP